MDKPHKQYLAIDLVRKVLVECSERMRMYRPELLNEVGKISFKPGKNGSLEAQRGAKKAAIDYLQSQGPEGQLAMQMAGNVSATLNMQPYMTQPALQSPHLLSPVGQSASRIPRSCRQCCFFSRDVG